MTSKTTPNQPASHEVESALDDPSGGIGGITALSIRRPLLMLMVILSVMIFGLIAYGRLGVDLFPSVNFPVVSVSIPYPGASPEVVESLVTRPVEDAVSGLADLDTINSTSSEGVAVVIVTFKDKADPQTVAIEVEKRVNGIRGQLPNDIIAPTILKFDFTAAPIITLGLTGTNVTPAQAFRIADELVRPKLETTNGVGQVSIFVHTTSPWRRSLRHLDQKTSTHQVVASTTAPGTSTSASMQDSARSIRSGIRSYRLCLQAAPSGCVTLLR